ncbi:hypothetical protein ACWZHB_27855 [Nocardia sp. FBN12]|uniref:hypothetical protein n=1 Tax=Nocardia sp. FBN12 TaxID=3419766 RepID=UPI003D05C312
MNVRNSMWVSAVATASCLTLASCGTTESDVAQYSTPPADCAKIYEAAKDSISSFAGDLFDSGIQFKSELPEQDFSKTLTCYGAYTAGTSEINAADGTSLRSNTIFISVRVNQADEWGASDPVEEAKRNFVTYRNQHVPTATVIQNLGDDAYSFKEIAEKSASGEVDFRIANATLHVRLNRSFAGTPSPEQGADVASSASALAQSLAAGFDSFYVLMFCGAAHPVEGTVADQ